jgi:hypothetical protein
MGMGHEHDADRRRPQPLFDRGEMIFVIWTWVDDDRDRAGIDDPRVRAGARVWTGIRGDDATD